MGIKKMLLKSVIKGITKAMCRSSFVAFQQAKEGKISGAQRDILDWALSMRTPTWIKQGDYTFRYISGNLIVIEPSDNLEAVVFKIILVEQGYEDLEAEGFTEDEIKTIIKETLNDFIS